MIDDRHDRLEGVNTSGGAGWTARCPAHGDWRCVAVDPSRRRRAIAARLPLRMRVRRHLRRAPTRSHGFGPDADPPPTAREQALHDYRCVPALTLLTDVRPGPVRQPGGVVLLTCEDDLSDTVRPRLDAAGADASRVVHLTRVGDAPRTLAHVDAIAEAIAATDAEAGRARPAHGRPGQGGKGRGGMTNNPALSRRRQHRNHRRGPQHPAFRAGPGRRGARSIRRRLPCTRVAEWPRSNCRPRPAAPTPHHHPSTKPTAWTSEVASSAANRIHRGIEPPGTDVPHLVRVPHRHGAAPKRGVDLARLDVPNAAQARATNMRLTASNDAASSSVTPSPSADGKAHEARRIELQPHRHALIGLARLLYGRHAAVDLIAIIRLDWTSVTHRTTASKSQHTAQSTLSLMEPRCEISKESKRSSKN